MSKVKKLLAMLMAVVMTLGMSVTAFAAGTASIKVVGLTKESTTVSIYRVVTWNQAESKWDIESWAQGNDEDGQPYVIETTNPYTINWDGLRDIIDEEATLVDTQTVTDGEVTFSGLDIGAYLIVAGGNVDAGAKTEYSAMGTFTYKWDESTKLMVPDNKEINAKGSDYTLTKTYADGSYDFVSRGETITYNIDTVFPSFEKGSTNRVFEITDEPTGLTIKDIEVYVADMDNPITEGTDYTLTPSRETWTENTAVTVSFTRDYLENDSHATSAVRVVVTAEVTGDNEYSNIARSTNAETPTTPVPGDTGSITINKEDTAGHPLTGATFSVSKDGDATKLQFVKTETTDVYKLATPEEIADSNITKYTDILLETGTLVLKGLDEGTYTIVEEKAPDGYGTTTINPVTITNGEIEDVVIDVPNSRLADLPSTGGIGTTIFTIGGCLIMIVAAGLFFATRRKAEK